MNCGELSSVLARDGWRLTRIRGTHLHFTHPVMEGVVMIPAAESDVLSLKALRSVLRRADRLPGTQGAASEGFLVVIEPTASGFAAYAPDLIGCVSTGRSVEETEASMRDAISGYVEELRDAGVPVPSPSASVRFISIHS